MNNYKLKLNLGEIVGLLENEVYQFRNIPYAKPPINELRFAKPQPMEKWAEVVDGIKKGYIAPQGISDLDIPMGKFNREQKEDCLTLTVCTPNINGDLPVVVWFHGGANFCGGGDLDWYDGKYLSKKANAVVVNLNYRLGALGFLNYPNLCEDNLCIEDQILALKWIKQNIKEFGGNPDKITAMGQSAGANSIVNIVSRKDTENLINSVILQSPSLGRGNHLAKDAHKIGKCILEHMGINTENKNTIKSSTDKCSVKEILDATDYCMEQMGSEFGTMLFKPVNDEWHTIQSTINAGVDGFIDKKIPLMIGMTKDELFAFNFSRDDESLKNIRKNQNLRFDNPAIEFARQIAQKGGKVWKYRFDWHPINNMFGACHCIELPFVFGNLDAWNAPMLEGAEKADMEILTENIQFYWSDFITNSKITLGNWHEYSNTSPIIKIFDNINNDQQVENF